MQLILQRHTTPEVPEGTCYGQTDLDLKPSFEAEFEAVATTLPSFDVIYSSPLQRCHRLAIFLGERFQLPVTLEPRLTEFDFGTWEGLLWNEIPPQERAAWHKDFLHGRPHGGDTVHEVQERLKNLLQDFALEAPAKRLLVTHAGVIRILLSVTEGKAFNEGEVAFGQHYITHNSLRD